MSAGGKRGGWWVVRELSGGSLLCLPACLLHIDPILGVGWAVGTHLQEGGSSSGRSSRDGGWLTAPRLETPSCPY